MTSQKARRWQLAGSILVAAVIAVLVVVAVTARLGPTSIAELDAAEERREQVIEAREERREQAIEAQEERREARER